MRNPSPTKLLPALLGQTEQRDKSKNKECQNKGGKEQERSKGQSKESTTRRANPVGRWKEAALPKAREGLIGAKIDILMCQTVVSC